MRGELNSKQFKNQLTELFKHQQEILSHLTTIFAGEADLGITSKKELEKVKKTKKTAA